MNGGPSGYKLQHARWKPGYHALSIWECVGELSDDQRESTGLKPPKAPATQLHGWYIESVTVANDAIEKMMQEV